MDRPDATIERLKVMDPNDLPQRLTLSSIKSDIGGIV